MAYIHGLPTSLRDQRLPPQVEAHLDAEHLARVRTSTNGPTAILAEIGRLLAEADRRAMVGEISRVQLESMLSTLTDAQGGLERIKKTPLPVQYRFSPSFFARAFCIILPFAIHQDLQRWTPVGPASSG